MSDDRAADTYLLSLESHRGWGRLRQRASAAVSVVGGLVVGAPTLSPSIGEWVVRRRDDGAEVLRIEAGADEEAAVLRASLAAQLAELSAEEFLERWSAEAGPVAAQST